MDKATAKSKHWERKAQADAEKIERAKKERDEAEVAHLATATTGDAKARVEDDLAKALNALAAVGEEGRSWNFTHFPRGESSFYIRISL